MGEEKDQSTCKIGDSEQYETLVFGIPCGIVVTEADERFPILFANQDYYELVGYEQEEYLELYQNIGIDTLYGWDGEIVGASAWSQLETTGSFSIKGRLHHKTKGYIWAELKGRKNVLPNGEIKICVMVSDISSYRTTIERLEEFISFHELIATLSEESYFECDLLEETMRCSKSFAERIGVGEVIENYETTFIELGLLTEKKIVKQKKRFLESKDDLFEAEFHFALPSGEKVWYMCRCTVLRDELKKPVRVVGKFIDITKHKQQIDELSHLALRDQLTGLYNKSATESLIKETLNMRRVHDDNNALMIIDIDNFKNVNDRLGHLYGDAVLTQLAEYLIPLFRSDDVVGRVGGDEFFVFLKNYRYLDILVAKAQEICNLFHKTYSEGDAFVTISASIGIALCPKHGTTFDELYQNADSALYDAKAKGKNTFSIYSEDLEQNYLSERTEIDIIPAKKNFKDNRIEYVFRLLYDSENPVSSIQAVLQLVTESFGFSRGYIFETSADGAYTSNTFEWCVKDVTAEIHNLQNIPIESVASANEAFEKEGMFILKSIGNLPKIERDVLEPQGIRSMFQFGIRDMGTYIGFIGFDNCQKESIPTGSEIDEICTVCHVLATFLLKHRSREREACHREAMERIIDYMNSYAYVVDNETCVILYENQNLEDITGHSSLGELCYKVYRGKDAPCEDCPKFHLNNGESRYTEELYSEKYDIYLRAEASLIDWSGNRKACLLCGMDVSEYRRAKDKCLEGRLEGKQYE